MSAANKTQSVLDELARVGEIASGILDGEDSKGIITELAMKHIATPDPNHPYMSGDYYDVDHETFLRTKKLMLRLERLGKVTISTSLWIPVPGTNKITVAVHNGVHHRFYEFGSIAIERPEVFAGVFETGQVARMPPAGDDPRATILAPVRDSLGDVVAVLELSTRTDENDPQWS